MALLVTVGLAELSIDFVFVVFKRIALDDFTFEGGDVLFEDESHQVSGDDELLTERGDVTR